MLQAPKLGSLVVMLETPADNHQGPMNFKGRKNMFSPMITQKSLLEQRCVIGRNELIGQDLLRFRIPTIDEVDQSARNQ